MGTSPFFGGQPRSQPPAQVPDSPGEETSRQSGAGFRISGERLRLMADADDGKLSTQLSDSSAKFAQSALKAQHDDRPVFLLHAATALEQLAKAVLARRHPSLIVTSNDFESLLHACGERKHAGSAPRSADRLSVILGSTSARPGRAGTARLFLPGPVVTSPDSGEAASACWSCTRRNVDSVLGVDCPRVFRFELCRGPARYARSWASRRDGRRWWTGAPDGSRWTARLSDQHSHSPPDKLGWRGEKTPWLVRKSYRGRIAVTARRIDRPSPVRFGHVYGQHLRKLIFSSDDGNPPLHGYYALPSDTLFRSTGCYAFQIRGRGFTEHLVVRAVG